MLKIVLFFIFTNLIQIEEKTHVPVTFHFPDYAFNENVYWFHECDVFLIHLFYDTQKLKNTSLFSLEKKRNLLARFSVKFVMLSIDLPACQPARARCLINKPALKS